jgi:hypothetical protein
MIRRTAPRLALIALVGACTLVAPLPHDAPGQQVLTQPLNNATSSLAQAHAVGSDTLVLQSGHGARFGTPTVASPIRVTVARQSTLIGGQIVAGSTRTIYLCTARSGDTLSGLTATEGTADQAFSKNDPVASIFDAADFLALQNRLSVTLDAKADFGAVGDGVTNDTAALRAGVAALKVLGGGRLILPRGTYSYTRGLRLPSNVTLQGQGQGVTTLTRPATVAQALTADAVAGAFTVSVASTTAFTVGHEVAVWDDDSAANWPTFGVITAKTATTLTLDTALDFAFAVSKTAKVGTVFQLITNEAGASKIRVTGLTLDGNRVGVAPDNVFPFASLEWRNATDCSVDDCEFVRAVADGYSDQANDYRIAAPDPVAAIRSTRNRVERCKFTGCPNYSVHLGTFMDGAYVTGNTIVGPSREAVHYSAYIRRTLSEGNYIADVTTAFGSLDVRDTGNVIKGNVIERCTGQAIPSGEANNTLILANRIDAPSTHAIHVMGDDCVVAGNVLTMGSSTGIGVWLDTANRCLVSANEVDGGAAGGYGMAVGNSSDARVSGNACHANGSGAILAETTRLVFADNTLAATLSGTALEISGTNTDANLRLQPTTGTVSGISTLTRGIVNGTGDNGATDPASGGSWNSISGTQWNGTIVRWGTPTSFSIYAGGVWNSVGGASLTSPTFVPTNNTTPAITARGLSGQARLLEWQDSTSTAKGYFSLKNFGNTYAGLSIASDPIPNLRLLGSTTAAGEGPSIFMGNATVGEVWQYFMPADTLGFGLLNRRVAGSAGSFGFSIYADASNRIVFGTAPSGTGYLPPTLTDQVLVNVGAAARKGVVVKAAASQTANLAEWQASDGTTIHATVSENGYVTTRKTAAPADAELATGEAAYWFDPTAGAAKFMVKAKDANGTVVTGSMSLTP